ncbi:hypothetical protein [Hyphomicrobium sp.]|uniref:hypothetical protein n=1 Tax=Hyphomicrobium sp. TaxID=82 RepID=UPI002E3334A0|nr:hypothetical protein [Hyphomicrobium sp.]HEX2839894.1 hypothetical protein [Hyphomicrobium sp.]
MRCVGVVLFAGASLLFALAPVAFAGDDAAVQVSEAKPSQDDYYTRRAKSILDAEKSSAQKPHPLAAQYPGMDVVVCEAGCPEGNGAHIVFIRKTFVATQAAEMRTEGMLQPTSGSDLPGDPSTEVACVAGCYDRTASVEPPPLAAASVGSWNTTVAPAPAAAIVRDKLSPIR